ncbi:MAG: hypothetical protein K2N92_01205, partial [Malacoplasma sp.]|nr:hypothetical protein [Malacoplasma sp.]
MENSITVVLVLVVFLFLWIVAISTIWFFSSNTNFAKIKENVKKRFNQKKIKPFSYTHVRAPRTNGPIV